MSHLYEKSYITPIFKSGNRECIRNYKPVFHLSAIPKLQDFIVIKQLYNKVERLGWGSFFRKEKTQKGQFVDKFTEKNAHIIEKKFLEIQSL